MATISGKSFTEWMLSVNNIHYSNRQKMDRALSTLCQEIYDEGSPKVQLGRFKPHGDR